MALTLIGLLAVTFIHTTTATPVRYDETRDIEDVSIESRTPRERNLWMKIRDVTVDDDDDMSDDVDTFISRRTVSDDIERAEAQLISSFTSQQRSLWGKIAKSGATTLLGMGAQHAVTSWLNKNQKRN